MKKKFLVALLGGFAVGVGFFTAKKIYERFCLDSFFDDEDDWEYYSDEDEDDDCCGFEDDEDCCCDDCDDCECDEFECDESCDEACDEEDEEENDEQDESVYISFEEAQRLMEDGDTVVQEKVTVGPCLCKGFYQMHDKEKKE